MTNKLTVILAANRRDGQDWARRYVESSVVIVTPVNVHSCRGLNATSIEETAAIQDHPALERMRKEAEVCLLHMAV